MYIRAKLIVFKNKEENQYGKGSPLSSVLFSAIFTGIYPSFG